MLLVIICWAHVEITVWMYPKCDWWIHWEKNDPEPTIYPKCSHWFPGHLAPSVSNSSVAFQLLYIFTMSFTHIDNNTACNNRNRHMNCAQYRSDRDEFHQSFNSARRTNARSLRQEGLGVGQDSLDLSLTISF